jgi:D-alanyl-D-alanine carboxypeptidase (penicillin-binding protein 5/6)
VALAEAASGSVGGFVAEMNAAASALGLADTSYQNPIGFDGPDQHSSARDLVELTLELRRRERFGRVVDTPEVTVRIGGRPRRLVNHNNLVRSVDWVNGVKTGYTLDAGYVLVGSGTRKGVTLVSALLGAPSEAARDSGTLALLRYGFSLYDRRTVICVGERLAAPNVRYEQTTLPLEAEESVRATVRRDQPVETQVAAPLEVEGPVRHGDRLGAAVVRVDGEVAARVALVASRSVPAPSFLDRADSELPGPRWAAIAVPLAAAAVIVIGIATAIGRRRYRRVLGSGGGEV